MAIPFLGGATALLGNIAGLPDLGISEALGSSYLDGPSYSNVGPANPATSTSTQLGTIANVAQGTNPQRATTGTDTSLPQTGVYYGTGGATGSQAAATQAYYNNANNQIDQTLGTLGGQGQVGQNNILGAYNSALQTLLNSKNTAVNTLDQNRNNTVQDNIAAKANIDTSVRNANTAVQRLLGARGSGSSSASSVLAPYAAATQGNAQRAGVQQAYGQNLNAIDTSLTDANNQYTNGMGTLNSQRDNQINALNSGIESTRAQLLQQKAQNAILAAQANGAGYDQAVAAGNAFNDQINQALGHVTALGAQANYTPVAVNLQAPNLAQYNTSAIAPPTPGQTGLTPAQLQNTGAYYTLLTGAQKDKNAPTALAATTA